MDMWMLSIPKAPIIVDWAQKTEKGGGVVRSANVPWRVAANGWLEQ